MVWFYGFRELAFSIGGCLIQFLPVASGAFEISVEARAYGLRRRAGGHLTSCAYSKTVGRGAITLESYSLAADGTMLVSVVKPGGKPIMLVFRRK